MTAAFQPEGGERDGPILQLVPDLQSDAEIADEHQELSAENVDDTEAQFDETSSEPSRVAEITTKASIIGFTLGGAVYFAGGFERMSLMPNEVILTGTASGFAVGAIWGLLRSGRTEYTLVQSDSQTGSSSPEQQ